MLVKAFFQGALTLFFCLGAAVAQAAGDVTLDCKKADTDTALDFSSLNLYISADIPPGTVLYSGKMNIALLCALNNSQNNDQVELYFKRKHIEDNVPGYGLRLYTGYGGTLGTEVENIATGKMVRACDAEPFCNTITLAIPFQIVKTSAEMTAPVSSTDKVNIFDLGAETAGTDLKFYATNIHSGITVRDETCSTMGINNLTVALGSWSLDKNGLGSGPGATSAATAFSLTLNCEALLSGAFDVMMQFNGSAVSGLEDKGVVALTAASNAAKNVGIQLLNSEKQPVALNKPFSVASWPLSSSTIKVPFYARYYQTGQKITAGKANGLVTYTLSYQ
ncbi:fimbrial protein [Kalamiella sp. sgz302252]|uniref:fimbrial protein n=1 Tax=Pantoea sp. sgz302252 TaxID=3341827 RepID=UPI0036D2982D